MHTRLLLIVTAVMEAATGVALVIVPSMTAELLLGAALASPESLVVGRVAGAALFSIGLTCWLEKAESGPRTGLVVGLWVYNISVALLLSIAAFEKMHGIALWPAVGLHSALAIWCAACLRSGCR